MQWMTHNAKLMDSYSALSEMDLNQVCTADERLNITFIMTKTTGSLFDILIHICSFAEDRLECTVSLTSKL